MRLKLYSLELDSDGKSILVENWAKYYTDESDLSSPEKIMRTMNDVFRLGFKAEEFAYLITTTTKCKPTAVFLVSKGTVDLTLLSMRDIFVRVLLCGAKTFIVVHNHPSGDPTPSSLDYRMTRRIYDCAQLLELSFVDHVIVTDNSYYSFSDNSDILKSPS